MSIVHNNRFMQKTFTTYKNKSDILEALHLVRSYINESTYKFLSHFLHTQGTGCTQAKITEICKLAGISTGTYSMIVKPEIENTFGQALIIRVAAPKKYDLKRTKKVRASEFKSLLPLTIIKKLVAKKQNEIEKQQESFFYSSLDVEVDVDTDIESNQQIPCGSKEEDAFPQQQKKAFRIKPLDNNKNLVNKNSVNNHKKIVDDLIFKYMQKGLDKKLCFKVISEIMPDGKIPNFVENIAGYIQGALKNTLFKSQVKHGLIDPAEKLIKNIQKCNIDIPYYDWLAEY